MGKAAMSPEIAVMDPEAETYYVNVWEGRADRARDPNPHGNFSTIEKAAYAETCCSMTEG